jgi:predicted TIM-barrel fold metal-dependent hydrolase
MARTYHLISGDSHLDLPPERWTGHVPAKWRDRAPHSVKLPNGADGVIVENRPLHTISNTRIAGRSGAQQGTYEGGLGTGSPEQRLGEQDQDGVDAEIMFTAAQYPRFWRGIRDNEGYLAMVRAYNTFLARDYCAAAPDRLFAMGVIPDTGVDDAIAEMAFCKQAGLKGVDLHMFPSGKGHPTKDDDRFWQAALDMAMPLCAHTGSGTTRFGREGPLFVYEREPEHRQGRANAGGGAGERDAFGILLRFAGDNPTAPMQMALFGVFDRFPKLELYFAESQAGWLPYAFTQVDDNYDRSKAFFGELYGLDPLPHPPSEYLKTNCRWGFLSDPFAVEMRDRIGVAQLIWGSDFAHIVTDWPHSRDLIDRTFIGVSPQERERMLVRNVVDYFHLDA